MRETGLALKYPTETRGARPNTVLMRMCNFSVIHRPVETISGVATNFASDGTYDDPGRTIGNDGAVSVRIVERDPIRWTARFAFDLAQTKGLKVTSTSKHTTHAQTDGFFERVIEEAHLELLEVEHEQELFDASLSNIIMQPENYEALLVLNEYGDFLSDLATGLVGSVGVGCCAHFAFNAYDEVDIAMFEATGGTADDIAGDGASNPTGILRAFGMLLEQVGAREAAIALKTSIHSAIEGGICSPDLGGSVTTAEFAQEIGDRLERYV